MHITPKDPQKYNLRSWILRATYCRPQEGKEPVEQYKKRYQQHMRTVLRHQNEAEGNEIKAILGDLNSRHKANGDNETKAGGRLLEDWLRHHRKELVYRREHLGEPT